MSEVEKTWEEVLVAFSNGDFNEVAILVKKVLDMQPDHSGALSLRKVVSARFDRAEQIYLEIDLAPRDKDLDDLIILLGEAIKAYPNHPIGSLIQETLLSRAKRYEDSLNEREKEIEGNRRLDPIELSHQHFVITHGRIMLLHLEMLLALEHREKVITQAKALLQQLTCKSEKSGKLLTLREGPR